MENRVEETFVGLDVHRTIVVATALDQDGRQLSQKKLGPHQEEIRDYLRSLPGSKAVALEACQFWERYYDAAQSVGAQVVLSNPYRTRLIAEASLKSDKVDSAALASLLRLNSLPQSFAPPTELRSLRLLVRERLFYLRKSRAIINHVYYCLMRLGIEYEEGILLLRRKREALRGLGIPEVDRGLDALRDLEDTTHELDRLLHEAFQASAEAQLLATIPGVGEVIAVGLVAFLCPIERFPHFDKVCSYVGLCPTTHQSANTLYHGRLKRDSNALVRWLLIQATWAHRRRTRSSIISVVSRRVARRAGKGTGAVAGARKLLKVAYTILKERRPYLPHAPERTAAKNALQRPRTAARNRVQRAVLEPSAANCLPAL